MFKEQAKHSLKTIKFVSPDILRVLYAKKNNNPLVNVPEELISNYIQKHDYSRLDHLGKEPGLWTLHPPFRSETFFKKLPSIITAVEKNNS